jgi:hypothetical protein
VVLTTSEVAPTGTVTVPLEAVPQAAGEAEFVTMQLEALVTFATAQAVPQLNPPFKAIWFSTGPMFSALEPPLIVVIPTVGSVDIVSPGAPRIVHEPWLDVIASELALDPLNE